MACLVFSVARAAADDPRHWKDRGRELGQEGDHIGAALMLERAVAADPDDLEAHDALAKHRIALGDLEETIAQLEPVVKRHPDYANGLYALAYCYRKTDRPDDAVVAYVGYIKLRPRNPDPYYGYADALRQLGDTAGALRAFHVYVTMETRPDASPWISRARQAIHELESGEPQDAPPPAAPTEELELRRTQVRDEPDDPEAWAALAKVLRGIGRTREAETAEKRAEQLRESPPAPKRAAGPDADKALMSMPAASVTRAGGGSSVTRRPEGKDALLPVGGRRPPPDPAVGPVTPEIERLRTAVRDDPGDAESWLLLAQALRASGRESGAQRAELRHRQLRPDAAAPARTAASPTGPVETARAEIGFLEAERRRRAAELVRHGDRLFRAERYDEAMAAFRQAAEADPASADAEYKTGLAAMELGKREEAAAAFDRALQRDPGHVDAREQRRRLTSF